MKASGLTAKDVRAQLARLFVMPVLTAHPTEARRRTLRDHVSEVKRIIDGLECVRGAAMAQKLTRGLRSIA